MPSESDLRNLFATGSAPNTLDAKRVISRSRARRLPKQLSAGAVGALAVTGIGVAGFQSIPFSQSAVSTMDQSAGTSEAAPEGSGDALMAKRIPAEQINLCGGGLAEVSSSFYGLQLDVAFPESVPAGTAPVVGAVQLTNLSDVRVTGSTAAGPAITLSQNGVVKWHSNGVMLMSIAAVDLAPGESLEYQASFTPVQCETADDLRESFRADLPPVAAGVYDLSALIYFSPDDAMVQTGTTELDLVSGPLAPVTIG